MSAAAVNHALFTEAAIPSHSYPVSWQALSSPISGVLGDKYDRTHIIAVGCFLWGIMTTAIGLSTSIYQVPHSH